MTGMIHASPRLRRAFLALALVLLLLGLAASALPSLAVPNAVQEEQVIPLIAVVSVVEDETVTVETENFPPNETFEVRMGPSGSQGIGGTLVALTDSGDGGSFRARYVIPPELHSSPAIAIRLESPNWFSFNWFPNITFGESDLTPEPTVAATPAGTPRPSPTPMATPTGPAPTEEVTATVPLINIVNVVPGESVTIETENFPANETFTVTMGEPDTMGVDGIVVGTTESGEGGSFQATYEIPPELADLWAISIRLESPNWFSYNWFSNLP